MELTTKLKNVKGLGSARDGTHHWIMQRVTALGLIPLIIWFACSILKLAGSDYVHAKLWMQMPFNAIALILLIPTVLYHGYLGIKVVIEDYVHSEFKKFVLILLIKFLFILISTTTLFAILFINFKL